MSGPLPPFCPVCKSAALRWLGLPCVECGWDRKPEPGSVPKTDISGTVATPSRPAAPTTTEPAQLGLPMKESDR
jgi:hypothetical protein